MKDTKTTALFTKSHSFNDVAKKPVSVHGYRWFKELPEQMAKDSNDEFWQKRFKEKEWWEFWK